MKKATMRILGIGFLALLILSGPAPAAAEGKRPVFDLITVNAAITADSELSSRACRGREIGGRRPDPAARTHRRGLDLAHAGHRQGDPDAPLPVIVYVGPSGARAASAGVIITVSAHVAAMTPGTNIGAAHPVALGFGGGGDKTMMKKVENDAVAYVRGIAKQRNRNEDWVERSVRKSESITAEEALKLMVIDIVAADVIKLLADDGRK